MEIEWEGSITMLIILNTWHWAGLPSQSWTGGKWWRQTSQLWEEESGWLSVGIGWTGSQGNWGQILFPSRKIAGIYFECFVWILWSHLRNTAWPGKEYSPEENVFWFFSINTPIWVETLCLIFYDNYLYLFLHSKRALHVQCKFLLQSWPETMSLSFHYFAESKQATKLRDVIDKTHCELASTNHSRSVSKLISTVFWPTLGKIDYLAALQLLLWLSCLRRHFIEV